MKIRQATQQDLETVVNLFSQYREFYKQTTDERAETEFIQQRLERQDSIIYVAWIHEEAAGFTQLYPIFSSVAMKRSYILNDLFVAKEFRRKGVAQALIEQCFAICEQQNVRALTLETASDNVQAQQLYEKIGFTRVQDFWTYSKFW